MKSNLFFEDYLDVIIYNYFDNINEYDELIKISTTYNISQDYIKKRYTWLKSMNINPNIIHLKQNHEKIYEIFDNLSIMLNDNNIEYYYTSGILSYLLVNKKLERYHHDLDVFVSMSDLEKLENICREYKFRFERTLGKRDEYTNRIMLKIYYDEFDEIPITVFMYTREIDDSIIQYDYFFDANENEYVEEIYNAPQIAELSFSNTQHYHNNIKFYSISLEALYLCKYNNRPKNLYDCEKFKDEIDWDKLNQLKNAYKNNKDNKIYPAHSNKYYNFIFSKYQRQKVLKK